MSGDLTDELGANPVYDGPKVFLSSTAQDLAQYRNAVLRAIAETEWFRCVAQENFGIATGYPRSECEVRVRMSNCFVALVGHYRGSEIEGDNLLRSFTEFEYDVAVNAGKPRLVAVQPDTHPIPPNFMSRGLLGDRQEEFRKRVMRDSVVGLQFGSEDRVALQVINALWKHEAAQKALTEIPQSSHAGREETKAAFNAALGEIAKEGVVDLRQIAKGTNSFDPALVMEELRRRGEAVVVEAESQSREKRRQAARYFQQIGAVAGFGSPQQARAAYGRAVDLDGENMEALYWHGWLSLVAGDLGSAERSLDKLLQLSTDRNEPHGLYRANLRIGDLFVRRGKKTAAREKFSIAYQIAARELNAEPSDVGWQRDLSVAHIRDGDWLREDGNFAAALKAYRASQGIFEQLAGGDPGNDDRRRDCSVVRIKLGHAFLGSGELDDALEAYKASMQITENLIKINPKNVLWQDDLFSAQHGIAAVLFAQGNLEGALAAYRESEGTARHLVEMDPGDGEWAYDRAIARRGVGDVLRAQGNVAGALEAYKDARAAIERLVSSSPAEEWISAVKGLDGLIAQLGYQRDAKA